MININSYTHFFYLLLFFSINTLPLTAQDIQLEYHLIGDYSLDGEVKDASGNDHHGDFYGAKLEMDRFGQPNGALKLGRKDFIKISDDFKQIKNEMSIALWILTTEDSHTNCSLKIPSSRWGREWVSVISRRW